MAIGQLTMQNLHFYTAHFDFTTAQIVINCTLKYALGIVNLLPYKAYMTRTQSLKKCFYKPLEV